MQFDMRSFSPLAAGLGLILASFTVHAAPSIIPQPVSMIEKAGKFQLTENTRIIVGSEDPRAARVGEFLARTLSKATGWSIEVRVQEEVLPLSEGTGVILLMTDKEEDLGLGSDEGYRLGVSPEGAAILATSSSGLFYGVQSLLQLLPPEVYADSKQSVVDWSIPAVTIEDAPRFGWRGLHLDVARHYMPVEFIKKYIDLLALHKMNTFHWHLTEDQGWRIEIKKYPRLTEVGSIRDESPVHGNRNKGDGKPYGPFFYTQDEVREIVAYAAERFITVVPEIELPGHSLAALVAYPELGCTGGPYKVRTRWGVEPDVYCAGNEKVFDLLEDVFDEVLELFPSKIIHIGGDECPKARWKKCPKCQQRIKDEGLHNEHELQSYFIQRVEKYLNAKGRKIIGWDEILEGGLAPNASVMSWRGEKGGITAAKAGHDVVMSPNSHCYFDHAQAKGPGEPEAIGGFLPLKKVYGYNPVPASLTAEEAKHVLGAQGNLWSEYLWTPADVEYFAFPRACALAEVVWSPAKGKDYADFISRMDTHTRRLDQWKVNYRKLDVEAVPAGEWKSGQTTEQWSELEWNVSSLIKKAGAYSVLFQYTSGTHRLDIEWVELRVNGKAVIRDAHPGVTGGSHKDNSYQLTLPSYDEGSVISIRARVRSDGGNDSNGGVFIKAL